MTAPAPAAPANAGAGNPPAPPWTPRRSGPLAYLLLALGAVMLIVLVASFFWSSSDTPPGAPPPPPQRAESVAPQPAPYTPAPNAVAPAPDTEAAVPDNGNADRSTEVAVTDWWPSFLTARWWVDEYRYGRAHPFALAVQLLVLGLIAFVLMMLIPWKWAKRILITLTILSWAAAGVLTLYGLKHSNGHVSFGSVFSTGSAGSNVCQEDVQQIEVAHGERSGQITVPNAEPRIEGGRVVIPQRALLFNMPHGHEDDVSICNAASGGTCLPFMSKEFATQASGWGQWYVRNNLSHGDTVTNFSCPTV